MSRTKDWWEAEYEAARGSTDCASVEGLKARLREAEELAARERAWAAERPGEWGEWMRVSLLLMPEFSFRSGEWYDFPQFLSEVGPRPSSQHVVRRLDERRPYKSGNLAWSEGGAGEGGLRSVNTPYLTVDEAAAYSRRSPKTLYNHHALGNLVSVCARPLLFRREDLDKWVSKRKRRK